MSPARAEVVELSSCCRADSGGGRVDVLLGHSLYMALDPKQVERMRPFPPLGTLYAASALREAGYRVALFDAMLAPGPEAFAAALDASRPRLVAIFEDSFNYLSKMCLSSMRQAGLAMLAMALDRGLDCLVAGSDATDHPEPWIEAGATAVLAGEAERSLVEASGRLLEGGRTGRADPRSRLRGLPGLILPAPGGLRRGPPREPEPELERFGLPARELVDSEAYRARWLEAHGRFSLNIAASRGCPYGCNWCARPIWGRRYAQRSAEAVALEVQRIAEEQQPDRLWFVDDVLGLSPGWMQAFAAALQALGLRLPFQAQSRVDRIDMGYAEALARAGCEEIWLGVESGSQRILDAMQKGIRVEDVAPATELLRQEGIRVAFFLQLGYPGETWRDIEATAALLRACRPDDIGVSVSYPLPGTSFFARVAEQLGPKRHWRDSRDLAMLFSGSYRTPFYRELHALLHREQAALRIEAEAMGPGVEGRERARRGRAEIQRQWAALAEREARERNPEATFMPLAGEAPYGP